MFGEVGALDNGEGGGCLVVLVCKDLVYMLLCCCLFAGCNPPRKFTKYCVCTFSRACILHHCICLDVHDHVGPSSDWWMMFTLWEQSALDSA